MNGSGTGFFNSRPPNLGFDDNSISDPDPRLERASNYVVKHKDSVVKVEYYPSSPAFCPIASIFIG